MTNAGTSIMFNTAATVWGIAQGAAADQGDVGAQNKRAARLFRAYLAASGQIG
jgi:hypothetical protein